METDQPRPRYATPGPNVTPAGHIPATDRTPDIFHATDEYSAKVAVVSFLTFWHLEKPLRDKVVKNINTLICALSPLAGGRAMEVSMQLSQHGHIRADLPPPPIDSTSGPERKYRARIYTDIKTAAVYPLRDLDEEEGRFTERRLAALKAQKKEYETDALSDEFHTFACDDPKDSAPIWALYDALADPDADKLLERMLHDETTGLYAQIPMNLCHEIGHTLASQVLQKAHALSGVHKVDISSSQTRYPQIFRQEIAEFMKEKNNPLAYFENPEEATAELIGAAIVKRISMAAGIRLDLQTNGLDEKMPRSFRLIETAVNEIFTPAPVQPTPREIAATPV